MTGPKSPEEDIRRLFKKHVPAVASEVVEIIAIAREVGERVLVAVRSRDPLIHAVSACVGEHGVHPKDIVRELHGEKVSIVLWSASPESFILNAVAPFGPETVQTPKVTLDHSSHIARIHVTRDVLAYFSQRPQSRLNLASKLVGWDIRLIEQ